MKKSIKTLRKKLSRCKFFIVLATKNYLKDVRNNDSEIMTQVTIAREMNMPFFIIIDNRLSQNEINDIRKYFLKDKVIKEISVDIGSKSSAFVVAKEINQVMKCMYPCMNEPIDIVTQDSIEKD